MKSIWPTALCCCFLVFGKLNAQTTPSDLNFNHLRLEDGLSESINCFIYEDSYGFVWISALDGLNRFDGVNIVTYRPNEEQPDGMKGKLIHGELSESDDSDIWFCTDVALNVYRRSSGQIEHFSFDSLFPSELSLEYYGITIDEQHYYWFKINDRLFRYHIYDKRLQEIGNIDGLRIQLFPEDRNAKTVYAYSKDNQPGARVFRYTDQGQWQYLEKILAKPPNRYHIHDQIRLADESFFFGTSEGLLYCSSDGVPIQLYNQFDGIAVKHVWAIEKHEETLILSSANGILFFDLQQKSFIRRYKHFTDDQRSLGRNKINELYLSKSGYLWASMWTKGVDYTHLNKVKFHKFSPKVYEPKTKSIDPITFDAGEVLEDQAGNIWCTSRQYGLFVFSNLGERLIHIDQNPVLNDLLGGRGIHQIFEDQAGYIYLLPWQNWLIRYDTSSDNFIKIKIPSSNRSDLGKLVQLNDGRILRTGRTQTGLMELKETAEGFILDTLASNVAFDQYYVETIFTRSGALLLTRASGGIDIFNYQNGQFKPTISDDWEGETFSILEMPNQVVYLGGAYGLREYDPNTKKINHLSKGWPSYLSNIYAIERQGDSILWLSSNYGLLRYNITSANFNTYTTFDGLQSREFNANSSLTTRNGEIWFGGINGYNTFHPKNIESRIPLAKVNLIDLEINDQSIHNKRGLHDLDFLDLAYWENNLTFSFVASEYSDPKSNQLRYRLEYASGDGYDADWVTVGNHEGKIRYPKLPPGDYRFLIYGSNSDQIWTSNPKILTFRIAIPFWKTWWFFMLIALTIIGLLISYYRRRLEFKNLKIENQQAYIKQEKALQHERDRLAKDMHDELGGGLTTIRLLLKKIKRKNPDLKNEGELNRIDHYSSEIIKNMRFIVWALQRENETLDNFIAYLRHSIGGLLEDHEIAHTWEISEEIPNKLLPGNCRKNLWLCVKEATHNIIKHAQADNVIYNLEWDVSGGLNIKISDNGVGIPDLGSKIFGYGLENIRNRMKKIGGIALFTSQNGTTVLLKLPSDCLNPLPKSNPDD